MPLCLDLNCTPHAINFYSRDGERLLYTLKPSGHVVRVKTPPQEALDSEARLIDQDENHPDCWVPVVSAQDFVGGEVVGLPPAEVDPRTEKVPNLIVGIVGAEVVARTWPGKVYATDTGPESVVRSPDGQILGVRRLQLIPSGR